MRRKCRSCLPFATERCGEADRTKGSGAAVDGRTTLQGWKHRVRLAAMTHRPGFELALRAEAA
jgi:hypothetical protein